jgi:hypothetical protein
LTLRLPPPHDAVTYEGSMVERPAGNFKEFGAFAGSRRTHAP